MKTKQCSRQTQSGPHASGRRYITRCPNPATPGFKTCADCREKNRLKHAAYLASRSRKSIAYQKRHVATRRALVRAWVAANPERRALSTILLSLIRTKRIVKPSRCQDCGRRVKLVAWGLGLDGAGNVSVAAFVCWRDWWRRRRDEEAG